MMVLRSRWTTATLGYIAVAGDNRHLPNNIYTTDDLAAYGLSVLKVQFHHRLPMNYRYLGSIGGTVLIMGGHLGEKTPVSLIRLLLGFLGYSFVASLWCSF